MSLLEISGRHSLNTTLRQLHFWAHLQSSEEKNNIKFTMHLCLTAFLPHLQVAVA